MAVTLSTLKIIIPMLMISIDIIQGRQQITIYSYPFFVPFLVYAASNQFCLPPPLLSDFTFLWMADVPSTLLGSCLLLSNRDTTFSEREENNRLAVMTQVTRR